MLIRRYQPGEEEAIWQIVYAATRISIAKHYHPDLIERWAPENRDMEEWTARLAKQNPLVAVVDEEPIGMAEIDSNGFIDYFYVHPDYHSLGIGKRLLAAVLAEATSLGVDRVYAYVSLTAEPFFLSQGFTVKERRANEILGHPAPNFEMERFLSKNEE